MLHVRCRYSRKKFLLSNVYAQPFPTERRLTNSMGTITNTISGGSFSLPAGGHSAANRLVSFEATPEQEIVRRAKEGDERAFAEIIQRHQNMVFSVAYRMVRRRMDAEDVAQQVFAKIFYALKKFDMRSSLSTWIYKIALNETYDYLRRLKNRRVVYEGDMSDEFGEIVEGRSVRAADRVAPNDQQSERRDYLMKLLEHLSDEERMLLVQKEVEGRTVDELSGMTGINGNTIKVKLFRARKKLLKAAEKLGERPLDGMG